MKLQDIPRNSNIRVIDDMVQVAPGSLPVHKGDELLFNKIDGMYSLCTMALVYRYPAAWTEVEIVKPETEKEELTVREEELERKLEPDL